MNALGAALYNTALSATERGGLYRRRQALIQHARGNVLEVGPGTGLNLEHYPPATSQLTLAEPAPAMRKHLQKHLAELGLTLPVTLISNPAQQLPYPDAHFDTVVCTLVLCSVPDPDATLRELRRVLRPDGHLLFIEHIAAKHGLWTTGQRLLEPLWKVLAGGCCLTRQTDTVIAQSGFAFQHLQHEPLPMTPGFLRPCIQGVATPAEPVTP